MDYSRAEGDRLVIEGLTTEIDKITYGDANGDGVMDHSKIWLYSEQGNGGGAHADDRLGTITVYGDLITEADIETTAAPAYGIVATAEDIAEAVKPTVTGKDAGKLSAPSNLPKANELGHSVSATPVLATEGDLIFDADARSAMLFDHTQDLNLKNGTVAFKFQIDEMRDWQNLFSKDARNMDDPGHISVYVERNGTLTVRYQDGEDSHYLSVDNIVKEGVEYEFALTFGKNGAEVYVNGAKVAYDPDVKVNWTQNDEVIVVGASGARIEPGTTKGVDSYLDGTISDFAIYAKQIPGDRVFKNNDRDDYAYFGEHVWDHDFGRNSEGVSIGHDGMKNVRVSYDTEFVKFGDYTVRLDDMQFGTRRDDAMYGRDGADILLGRTGNDRLYGNDNDDVLIGADGDDELFGGDGKDALFGDAGEDRLFGGNGNDLLKGGIADDDLYGGAGNDKFYGGLGDDNIYGDNWNSSGSAANDRAYFDGNLDDYSFVTETWYDKNRDANVSRLVVTDSADGGLDGFYEGRDRLMDIDYVVFADQTVSFDTLL
jgi:Ca2+-binding RTX toxin-like protein